MFNDFHAHIWYTNLGQLLLCWMAVALVALHVLPKNPKDVDAHCGETFV